MADSFLLTLDTVTHLAAAINGGKPETLNPTVTLELALDPDAAEVKIWGTINPLDPMNAGMGETEEGAEWMPATPDFLVALTTNLGLKELNVRVRDDVLNEAEAHSEIRLVSEEPPPTPTPTPPSQQPEPAGGDPEPVVVPKRIQIECKIDSVRIVERRPGLVSSRATNADGIPAPVSGLQALRSRPSTSPSQVVTRVEVSIAARIPDPGHTLEIPRTSASVGHRDDEEYLGTLQELGIL